jgi:hypothetical protein
MSRVERADSPEALTFSEKKRKRKQSSEKVQDTLRAAREESRKIRCPEPFPRRGTIELRNHWCVCVTGIE